MYATLSMSMFLSVSLSNCTYFTISFNLNLSLSSHYHCLRIITIITLFLSQSLSLSFQGYTNFLEIIYKKYFKDTKISFHFIGYIQQFPSHNFLIEIFSCIMQKKLKMNILSKLSFTYS